MLLQQRLLIEEKPKEIIIDEYPDTITAEEFYTKEYEESHFDNIEENIDETINGIEYAYANLFDTDMLIERGKTIEMDIEDYVYWETQKP